MLCQHCGLTKPIIARGLCRGCHQIPHIRELYSCRFSCGKVEPTQEEVDAVVAAQSEHLPDWWDESYAETLVEEPVIDIPAIRYYRLGEIARMTR